MSIAPTETFEDDERDRLLLKISVELGNSDRAEEIAWGLQARCQYGQGFVSAEPLQIKNLMRLVDGDQ